MFNGNNGDVTDIKSPILFFVIFAGWIAIMAFIMITVSVTWDQFYKNLLLSFSQLLSKGLPLCFLVVIFDLISPGAWLKKIEENPYACAGVIAAFLLAYGMMIN